MNVNDTTEHLDLPATVATIRTGYGDVFGKKTRMLRFLTVPVPGLQAAKLVRLVPDYNDFDGPAVADWIEQTVRVWPQALYQFGRDFSPVLYVRVPNGSVDPKNARRLVHVKSTLAWLHPDELDAWDDGSAIRAWWD